jgi:hypothetical protein
VAESVPQAQVSAARQACFQKVDSARRAWFDRVLQVGSVLADLCSRAWRFRAWPAALLAGQAVPVWFGRAPTDGLVLAGPDFQAWPVALLAGQAVSVWFGQAPSDGLVLAGPDFRVWLVFQALGSGSVWSDEVLPAGSVCRVWTAVVSAAGHPADFQVGWADSPDGLEAYSSADDNANCRGSRGGSPIRLAADDTNSAADDMDSTNRPNSRGCSRRDALPSSIPIHPIPKAGYQPAAHQSRFQRRN